MVSTRKGIDYRKAFLVVVLSYIVMTVSTLTVYAAGVDVGTFYRLNEGNLPSWDEMDTARTTLQGATDEDRTTVAGWEQEERSRHEVNASVCEIFGSRGSYDRWVQEAQRTITYDASRDELLPIGGSSSTTQQWNDYHATINDFNSAVGKSNISGLTGDVWNLDGYFNPNNAAVSTFMTGFYKVMNTIIGVSATALMWLFLGQTGLDILYLVIPFMRKIFRSTSGKSMEDVYNMGEKKKSGFRINLVSDEAVEAVADENRNEGYSGGMYGGAMSAGKMKAGWFRGVTYITSRAPLMIIMGAYLVLARTNLWPRLISFVAGIVSMLFGLIIGG